MLDRDRQTVMRWPGGSRTQRNVFLAILSAAHPMEHVRWGHVWEDDPKAERKN